MSVRWAFNIYTVVETSRPLLLNIQSARVVHTHHVNPSPVSTIGVSPCVSIGNNDRCCDSDSQNATPDQAERDLVRITPDSTEFFPTPEPWPELRIPNTSVKGSASDSSWCFDNENDTAREIEDA